MSLRVAVDFGTSSTCVVASVNGREPQVVVVDGQPIMPSAVYAAQDGTVFVGQEAERQAAVDPARFEPNPKRRIDEGELLLGDTVLSVVDAVHAVLQRAVSEARRIAGNAEVALLVLTHPAEWGALRTRLLRQAAGRLAREVALVPEPVAAAVYHAATFAPGEVNQDRTVEFSGRPGDTTAVLDLGGGTIDVSVVRRAQVNGQNRFEVLATRGDPGFGGADIDQALLEHVGSLVAKADPEAWDQLVQGRELADRRRRRVLRQDVRGAKETLSRHAYTDVPMPPPFADAHVTREDLERLVRTPLGRAAELTRATIEEAGLRPQQLTAIFLVGGSSRIPMVSRLVHERTGVVPTTLDQPETVVARGALRAVQVLPDRTGVLPGTMSARFAGTMLPQADHRTDVVTKPGAPLRQVVSHNVGRAPLSAPTGPGPGHRPPPPKVGVPPPMPPGPPPLPSLGQQPTTPVHGTAALSKDGASRRRQRVVIAAAVTAVALVATVVALVIAIAEGNEEPTTRGRTYAQYSYKFVAPQDWTQTGDNVEARQVVVKPQEAQTTTDDDLVVVQEIVLPYDGGVQRQRLARELRELTDAEPGVYSGFSEHTEYAGRDVIHYREDKPAATVNWYVLAHGTAQVSVGCQEAQAPARVRAACEQIVRTLEFTN
ncbi:type VII secretion-associated protein [Saccharomonospora xinjiangensis]|uniref:Type VII secretion-associated protein, Rv3446c family, C-terminal domain n=1 Tax=Saccharomonospora xinjiangensis XJ-54 TaxID=882086 RepID=I0V119_9PSEU|nr:type VII secretion-associated protein [Saccharomonospora xinjiangensis]EID53822.1 type VII secretion-associated protein, Rv3446c family, C-terminal domain [Saccharomonospora xinjiangensis XJ-54]